MEPVIQPVRDQLFQYGVLGVFCFVFLAAIFYLWREGREERKMLINEITRLQQLRVDDAKATQAQLIEIARQSTLALSNVTSVVETTRLTMIEVRDTLRELGDEVRNSRGPRGR